MNCLAVGASTIPPLDGLPRPDAADTLLPTYRPSTNPVHVSASAHTPRGAGWWTAGIVATTASSGGVRIGYASARSVDPNLDLERDALQAVGCEHIFEDKSPAPRSSGRDWWRLWTTYAMATRSSCVGSVGWVGRCIAAIPLVGGSGLESRGRGFGASRRRSNTTTQGGRLISRIARALAEPTNRIEQRSITSPDLGQARPRLSPSPTGRW